MGWIYSPPPPSKLGMIIIVCFYHYARGARVNPPPLGFMLNVCDSVHELKLFLGTPLWDFGTFETPPATHILIVLFPDFSSVMVNTAIKICRIFFSQWLNSVTLKKRKQSCNFLLYFPKQRTHARFCAFQKRRRIRQTQSC